MFGPLGFWEIAFILVLALLIVGPKRLPEFGRTIGRGLGEFRRASNELKRTINTEIDLAETEDETPRSRRPSLSEEETIAPPPVRRVSPPPGAVAQNAETSAADGESDGESEEGTPASGETESGTDSESGPERASDAVSPSASETTPRTSD